MSSEDKNKEREYRISELLYDSVWLSAQFYSPLVSVLSRLPLSVIIQLIEMHTVFFAPDPSLYGRVMRVPRSLDNTDCVVYLSPTLLDSERPRHKDEVEFTIAHELAHVILRHEEEYGAAEVQGEQQADELALQWGFTFPPSFRRAAKASAD